MNLVGFGFHAASVYRLAECVWIFAEWIGFVVDRDVRLTAIDLCLVAAGGHGGGDDDGGCGGGSVGVVPGPGGARRSAPTAALAAAVGGAATRRRRPRLRVDARSLERGRRRRRRPAAPLPARRPAAGTPRRPAGHHARLVLGSVSEFFSIFNPCN